MGHNGAGKSTLLRVICGLHMSRNYDSFAVMGSGAPNNQFNGLVFLADRWVRNTNFVGIHPFKMDILVRNMSKKQLDQLRNNLEEKEGLYIHAAVSDTGRLQVRQFPWSSRKNETNYISDKELKKIDRTIRKELGGTDAKKYKSNVGFVIWRMKEMNLIDAKYTAQDIIDTLPTYFKTEPYTDVTKMQKYTKHMSGIEVPIDSQYIKDEYTHALIKDLLFLALTLVMQN